MSELTPHPNDIDAVNLGYIPRKHQRAIHIALSYVRFAVLVCHRRFGKTVMAVMTLIDAAMRFGEDGKMSDGQFAYIAPYYRQAKKVAWLYFKKYCSGIPGIKFNESELSVRFPNGSVISLHGSDNPDSMRGVYFDGVVMDEVATMRPEVWGEIVRPALADRVGWALFIGTPKGQNLFWELYQKAKGDTGWYGAVFRADETEVLSTDELISAKSAMSDSEFRQEFLCDFGASSDDILITIDIVSNAAAKRVMHEDALFGLPKIMTVDVARYGKDLSVIGRRHGHLFYEPEEYRHVDNMMLAGVVAQRWKEWEPDACFIDGGRGEGVIDRLRQLGFNPVEVLFGSRKQLLDPTHYHDKRMEMYALGKEWLEAGGVLPNHSRLKSDICGLSYDFGGVGGSQRLEPKDKIRKEKRVSTDFGDAWALSFAFPVQSKDKLDPLEGLLYERGHAMPNIKADYDPYPVEEAN